MFQKYTAYSTAKKWMCRTDGQTGRHNESKRNLFFAIKTTKP